MLETHVQYGQIKKTFCDALSTRGRFASLKPFTYCANMPPFQLSRVVRQFLSVISLRTCISF